MTSIPAVWEIELVSQTSLMHKLSIHLDGLDEGVETLQWKTATSPASTIHGNSNCFLQKPTHQIPSLHILTVWTAVHTNGLLQPTRWAMAYRQKKTQIQRSGQDELYNQGCCFLGLRMEGGFSKSFMWVGGRGSFKAWFSDYLEKKVSSCPKDKDHLPRWRYNLHRGQLENRVYTIKSL